MLFLLCVSRVWRCWKRFQRMKIINEKFWICTEKWIDIRNQPHFFVVLKNYGGPRWPPGLVILHIANYIAVKVLVQGTDLGLDWLNFKPNRLIHACHAMPCHPDLDWLWFIHAILDFWSDDKWQWYNGNKWLKWLKVYSSNKILIFKCTILSKATKRYQISQIVKLSHGFVLVTRWKNTVFNLFQRTLPQCSHVFSFPGSIIQEMFLKCL